MKFWKRATGALKDQNSIWAASLSRRTPYRHPDLEALIIKATSHDDTMVDYKSARRVFQWIRTSPIYVRPLAWALTNRMEKTRSWVVALKGLMLIHGVFCCKYPSVQKIGRLPFDLSNFSDGHSTFSRTWGYNVFVRKYYTYLDHKSAFLSMNVKKQNSSIKTNQQEELELIEEIEKLQKWQNMLDMLLQITPQDNAMKKGVSLIIEAMNNLVIEIFDIYSKICSGIAKVLLRIYASPLKGEAAMALSIIQKAAKQVEDLSVYLEVCREMGVLNASEIPKLDKIPEEDIRDLERIINGASSEMVAEEDNKEKEEVKEKAMVLMEAKKDSKLALETTITEKWELFDGESTAGNDVTADTKAKVITNQTPIVLPDLITF